MSADLRTRYARIWLRDAVEDLRAAEHCVQHPEQFVPRQPGFFAQQAAEKALKGALTFAGAEDQGPTHDIATLIASLPDAGSWRTKQRYSNVAALSKMAAQTRYLINAQPLTWDDVRRAVNLAHGIVRSCLQDMEANGFQAASQQGKDPPHEQSPG